MWQLDGEERSLKGIEPRVGALHRVQILLPLAVVPQQPDLLGDALIVGDDHAAVAAGAEILRRIEAERGGVAGAANDPPAGAGAMGLSSIFDNHEVVPAR